MTASDGHGSVATAWVPRSTNAIECGIGAVNADDVWIQTGLRGEGIVVGTMDTGVEWTHPALQGHYRGWDGATADHSYSWHDAIQPTAAPLDDNNHGTHVTGTMVGDDGGANQIGVAPGAKWVGCRNMDHGNGTPATYLDCIQWGLAPYPLGGDPFKDGRPDLAPDITNNSWSCPPSEGCDPFSLQQAFENVRAAGQMTVGAAQNAGPNCSTVTSPLGLYDAVFTAGAVDCAGALAGFSSRGPITVDGSNRMKPNVAAPGVNVRSSVRGGQYASLNGTSMATPHTAGVMALLWSVKPNLRHLIGISRCYLEQSATTATLPTGVPQTCGGTTAATHPNNFWGWGKIDALGAVNLGPDGDTDGIADACDCAPADTGAFDAPPEISGARFTDPSTMEWQSLAAISGTGTTYDVVRGLVSQLRASAGFADAVCLSNDQTSASYTDIDLPNPDDAFYYLVRGQNGCGTGAWGRGLLGAQRVITICP
jgi:subtilisin family serine protease